MICPGCTLSYEGNNSTKADPPKAETGQYWNNIQEREGEIYDRNAKWPMALSVDHRPRASQYLNESSESRAAQHKDLTGESNSTP